MISSLCVKRTSHHRPNGHSYDGAGLCTSARIYGGGGVVLFFFSPSNTWSKSIQVLKRIAVPVAPNSWRLEAQLDTSAKNLRLSDARLK